jgi:hypothetical protein
MRTVQSACVEPLAVAMHVSSDGPQPDAALRCNAVGRMTAAPTYADCALSCAANAMSEVSDAILRRTPTRSGELRIVERCA